MENNQVNGIIHDPIAELTKGIANNPPAANTYNIAAGNPAPSPAVADNGLPELDFLKEAAANPAPGSAVADNGLPELDFLKEAAANPASGPAVADNGLPELDFLKDPAYADANNTSQAAIPPAMPAGSPVTEPAAAPETVSAAPPAASQNPAIKYGRRMDYKTAKVDNGVKRTPLNLSVPNRVHNPLPTPKKRVPKELDYDIQPSMAEMHFDIVDLKGIDFFDIN